MSRRDPGATSPGARLVYFPADPQGASRRSRRSRILAMRPTDPTESRIAARSRQGGVGGGHWELLRADGLALLVRTRNVDDLTVARVDADRVFARRDELRVLYVRDHEAGQLSWWLVDRTEAVLVAARVWSAAQRTEVLANARLALAALAAPHPWGEYDPF